MIWDTILLISNYKHRYYKHREMPFMLSGDESNVLWFLADINLLMTSLY